MKVRLLGKASVVATVKVLGVVAVARFVRDWVYFARQAYRDYNEVEAL